MHRFGPSQQLLICILEHAKLLLSRLIASIPDESTDKVTTASLISNIDANVKVHFVDESIDLVSSLPVKASTDTCERQKDLDDLGVKLWNTSTRLLRFLDDGDQGLKEKETVVRGSLHTCYSAEMDMSALVPELMVFMMVQLGCSLFFSWNTPPLNIMTATTPRQMIYVS